MAAPRRHFFIPLILTIAAGSVCLGTPETDATTYSVHGRVLRLDKATSEVVIAHDAIGDYMPAMTMPFQVRKPNLLTELTPGDVIDFQLHLKSEAAWIDHVAVKAHLSSELEARPAPELGRELKEGDTATDIEFVTSKEQRARLSDLRGQPVAVTFIYTRCPLPTYCPLVNRNFSAAQQLLRRLQPSAEYRFISITLDPTHDSSEVMNATLDQYNADRAHWDFASTSNESLRRIGDAVGLEYRRAPSGAIDHNLRTVVLDRTGRIQKIFRGSSWTAQELAAEFIRPRK